MEKAKFHTDQKQELVLFCFFFSIC